MFDDEARENEDGMFGRCLRCNRRIWIESGCSPLCDTCDDLADYDAEKEAPVEQTDREEEA
jgi:hypothetical protein